MVTHTANGRVNMAPSRFYLSDVLSNPFVFSMVRRKEEVRLASQMSSGGRSVSPGSFFGTNMVDELTPGIFAHAAPLQTFAAPLPPQHRAYVDEGNDDLVVMGPGCVTFSRAAIVDDSSSRAAARQFYRASSSSAGAMESSAADFGATLFREGSLMASGTFTGAASMNDLLFGSPRGAAAESSPRLDDGESPPADRSPDPEPNTPGAALPQKGYCDAFVLRTKTDEILMAKRPCTRTSTKQHGGVAAVMHDPMSLCIYNLFYVPPNSAPHSPAGTAPAAPRTTPSASRTAPAASRPAFATSASAHFDPNQQDTQARLSQYMLPRDGPLEPLAVYQCRPKNVRFGNGAYPIRDFFWLPAPRWASCVMDGAVCGSEVSST